MHRLAFQKMESQRAKSSFKMGQKTKKIQHDYGTNIMVEESHDSKVPVGQKRCKCNSTSHLRTNHSECPLNPKRKRNASAVSGHTMNCATRVTAPSHSSKSDREETSPTREMSPLKSEASSDLECIENSDVILRVRIPQTLNQTLKWRSSVSPRQCLYALVPLVLNVFPTAETVSATPEMLYILLRPAYIVTGPLPTVEWKDLALKRLSSLAGVSAINKIRSPDPLKPVPCREIAPHIRDVVRGDGHCFFRALSKESTGTENNHLMVMLENEVILARHVSQKEM